MVKRQIVGFWRGCIERRCQGSPEITALFQFDEYRATNRRVNCHAWWDVRKQLIASGRIEGSRLLRKARIVAFAPYAAHLPFETWILPRRPQAAWDTFQPAQCRPLAEVLKTVLLKLYDALGNPDFNLTVDMAPRSDEELEYFVWHIRVLPRIATPAGFEMGSGMSINTTMPEDAAAFLRDGDAR